MKKTAYRKFFAVLAAAVILSANAANAQTVKHRSFAEQNLNRHYTSIAFGMGVNYVKNKSLDDYIGYELPNYNFLNDNLKLSEFRSGFDFFISAERQIHRNFSLKAEYSYFLKSNKSDYYAEYSFNSSAHRLFASVNYLFPMEYAYFKLGIGGGGVFSSLTKSYGSLESDYTSTGLGIKAEGTFDLQIGNSMAVYLNGNIINVFDSGLKDSNGDELFNKSGGRVNLSGLSFGLRLGVEFFIF